MMIGPVASSDVYTVIECNPFYVTLKKIGTDEVCFPLSHVNISFDTPNRRLKLEVVPT